MKRLSKIVYTPLLEKVNFVEVLLNLCICLRNHCSHMVLKDLGRNSIFFGKSFDWFDRISSYTRLYSMQYCTYFFISYFWEKKRIYSACMLSVAVVLMNWKNKINSEYLSQSKIPCSDLYSNWLKKNSLGLK